MKQTISLKDTEHIRVMKHIDKIDKEKNSMKLELQNATVAAQHARSELAEKEHECRQLYRALSDEERKCTKTEKRVEGVQNEKDQIGTEMVKKTGEIESMKEKVQLMQRALDRGMSYSINELKKEVSFFTLDFFSSLAELQCTDRMEDVKVLKMEIQNIRYRNDMLTRGLCDTIDMRQEVLQLHRDLTLERVKSKALEEEMSTPMNVHRWRALGGKDPEKIDLIIKIQTLQK